MTDANDTYSWRALQIAETTELFAAAAHSENWIAQLTIMSRLTELAKIDSGLDAAMKTLAAEAAVRDFD